MSEPASEPLAQRASTRESLAQCEPVMESSAPSELARESLAQCEPVRESLAPGGRERGSASVWAAGGIAALLLLVALIVGIGAAAATRHRAASAADLAALAAAGYATAGAQVACARAGWVAERMGVRVTACRLRGWDAEVEIAAHPPDLLVGFGEATARARAGPVAE